MRSYSCSVLGRARTHMRGNGMQREETGESSRLLLYLLETRWRLEGAGVESGGLDRRQLGRQTQEDDRCRRASRRSRFRRSGILSRLLAAEQAADDLARNVRRVRVFARVAIRLTLGCR